MSKGGRTVIWTSVYLHLTATRDEDGGISAAQDAESAAKMAKLATLLTQLQLDHPDLGIDWDTDWETSSWDCEEEFEDCAQCGRALDPMFGKSIGCHDCDATLCSHECLVVHAGRSAGHPTEVEHDS